LNLRHLMPTQSLKVAVNLDSRHEFDQNILWVSGLLTQERLGVPYFVRTV
jgi:hypothetical protein